MSAAAPPPAVIGLRAGRGGCVAVAVTAGPRVVLSTVLATAEPGDRLALEPYAVAYERARQGATAEAAAAVEEGRRRQDALAAAALSGLVERLRRQGEAPASAALLVNRAGWITDLLAYSLGAPEHPAVAEGLAVREAMRAACRHCGLTCAEIDEKSLPEAARDRLTLGADEIEATLKALGADAGKPWRKEQKLAALAAWAQLGAR
ncbi:MAG: hypothetical protein JNK30_03190 [Phenylobacterium sp.]|uniref:hypothetical protein n=1 Tax=Phenylobacterium sp. TaxID=1871053 RepID=UPI001A51362E|nr:hypothetical protein [Phenylobacterium sp.]MBL8770361.1 hypothetical protein [Phenylobacterium sp.]